MKTYIAIAERQYLDTPVIPARTFQAPSLEKAREYVQNRCDMSYIWTIHEMETAYDS